MSTTTTPNMGLLQPTVLVEVGPTWASDLNTSLGTVDSHNHTSGQGVQVPTAGININADLSYTGFGPINMLYARLTPHALPTAGTKPASIFVSAAGDLWFEDNASNQIRLTQSGQITPNGTGANNGFFGFGGTGYAGHAQAGFDGSANQYLFYRDTTQTNIADVVMGNLTLAAADPTTLWFRPDGVSDNDSGFKITTGLDNNGGHNSFYLAVDANGDGTYIPGIRVVPQSAITNLLAINTSTPATGGVFQADELVTSTNGASSYSFWNRRTSGGTPTAGFGGRQMFQAAVVNGSNASLLAQASLNHWWSTVNGSSSIGRVALYAWSVSGQVDANSIQVDGGNTAGILAACGATSGAISVGGAMWPTGNISFNLGDSTRRWATIYASTLDLSGAATVGGALGVTGTSTLGVTGTGALTSTTGHFTSTLTADADASVGTTLTAGHLIPTNTPGGPTAGAGGSFKNNQVVTWGKIPSSGTTATSGFNVASISWASNVCTVTLTTALTSSTTLMVLATVDSTDTSNPGYAQAQVTSATTVQVTTMKAPPSVDPTATALGFGFVIIGQP